MASLPAVDRAARRAILLGMRAGLVGAGLLGAALAAGCGSARPVARPSPPPSPAPDPAATALAQRAAASLGSVLQAAYAARTRDGQVATLTVYLGGRDRYRVDVVQDGATASLYGTPAGTVACTVHPGSPTTCFLVAAPGKPVPARFDAGLQRVFIADLPALALHADAFVIRPDPDLPAAGTLPAARCFTLTGVRPDGPPAGQEVAGGVDLGTYCLTAGGLPRQLTFTSGTLTLGAVGAAPTGTQLTPPVPAASLPPVATGSG